MLTEKKKKKNITAVKFKVRCRDFPLTRDLCVYRKNVTKTRNKLFLPSALALQPDELEDEYEDSAELIASMSEMLN